MATKIMDVTNEEIFAEIAAILSHGKEREPGTFTTPELAKYLRCCIPAAQKKVRRLLELGIIEKARVRIIDLADRETSTFGFRYIGKRGVDSL